MQPSAIKVQWHIGERAGRDLRGGEPQDQHGTIAEIDPATEEQVALVLAGGDQIDAFFTNILDQLRLSKALGAFLPNGSGIGVYVMDGDGSV